MASLPFLGTTTDGHGAHDIESGDTNTTREATHNSLEDYRVPTVVVDGKTRVTNDDGRAQDAEDVPVLHEHAELAQGYQEMLVDDAQPVRREPRETPWQPSSTEDTRVIMDSPPITADATEAVAGHMGILVDQAAAHSVDGLFTEEVPAVDDAVVAANGDDGVQLSQAVQGGGPHALQNATEPTGAMQPYNFTDGDIFVLHAHGHNFIAHVRAVAFESTVYLHLTLIFLGGRYTTLDVFAGHRDNHLASDLGFVFGGDVFDSNDSEASALPSDLGAVFGDVQHVADNVFGPAHEDGGIFESDLGFVFNP